MRLGASEFVTSPQSDLTMHDAPELSVTDPKRGKGSVTLSEGAIVRWVAVAPLLVLRVAKPSLRINLKRADKIELKKSSLHHPNFFLVNILRTKNIRKFS
jgi:hypothetical protein